MTDHPSATAWPKRWQALLGRVARIPEPQGMAKLLRDLKNTPRPTVLAFVNAHAMNSVAGSAEFFQAIMSADIIVRDGSGMLALFRLLALQPGLNLNGTDFIPRIIRQFNGAPIALYGTQTPYLEDARADILARLAPGSTVTMADGFKPAQAYIDLAMQQRPALIVLGMGMPKQEQVAQALRQHLQHPCLIVCGGAIIDFLGGKTERAPRWMRQFGMEWMYRLGQEPGRLFNRYVIGNPLFLLRSVYMALVVKTQA